MSSWEDQEVLEPAKAATGIKWEDHPVLKMAETSPESSLLDNAKEFGKAIVHDAPGLGMMVGGTLGGVAGGPAGAMAGAGIGGYLGSAAKNAYNAFNNPDEAPETASEYITQPLQHGAEGVALEGGAHVVGKGLKALSPVGKYIAQKLGKAASYGGEALTGAPAQDIYRYGARNKVVNDLIKGSDKNSATLADKVRKGYQESFTATRAKHNAAIEAAENAASGEKTIPNDKIVAALEREKIKLDPDIDAAQIKQIDELIADVTKSGDNAPNMLGKRTGSLQGKANYGTDSTGKALGSSAQKAAKGGAAEARLLRNEHVPGAKEPFQKLEKINEVADVSNPNLFTPNKPDPAFYAAGSGRNQRGVQNLEEMGKATGTDMLGPAQDASAARTFMSPSLTPLDTTGKSLYRLVLATKIPGLSSVAGLVTSPAALKVLIDSGVIASDVVGSVLGKTVGKLAPSDYVRLYGAFKTAQVEDMRQRTFDHIKNRKSKVIEK